MKAYWYAVKSNWDGFTMSKPVFDVFANGEQPVAILTCSNVTCKYADTLIRLVLHRWL